jgi:8-oxo-dGTP pyrophosphatase MutT (NUDIX family)
MAQGHGFKYTGENDKGSHTYSHPSGATLHYRKGSGIGRASGGGYLATVQTGPNSSKTEHHPTWPENAVRTAIRKSGVQQAKDEMETAPNSGIPLAASSAPKGRAASVLFTAPSGRCLFVKRAADEENYPDTWALPGGKADDDEDFGDCAAREAGEETGRDCALDMFHEVDRKRTPYGWDHVTYLAPVDEEFEPTLNGEHSEHAWAPWNSPPGPLHPGVAATLASLGERRAAEEDQADDVAWRTEHGAEEPDVRLTTLLPLATRELHSPDSPSQGKGAADMAPQKWSLLRRLFGEWLTEEEREPEHVGEDEIKHDPATGQFTKGQSNAHKRLIRQGMEHKGTTSEGHQVYEHPDRDEQVRVKPNGSAYGRGPKTTKDESFEKVEHSLAHKKGVHDPKALAAWIGREHGKIPGKDTHLAGDRTLPLMSQDASGAWAYDSALLLASARRARARGRADLARRAETIHVRQFERGAVELADR